MLLEDKFFLDPMRKFGVRELSRTTKMDTKTTMKYLKELQREKIILRKEELNHIYYEANRQSPVYRHEKSARIVRKIFMSGLIEHLEKKLKPKVIILFGSIQKGTYHENSDIDIFIQTDYKRLNLNKYDRKVGRKISLFFEKNPKSLSKGLLNNIYSGMILSGNLEVIT